MIKASVSNNCISYAAQCKFTRDCAFDEIVRDVGDSIFD